MRPTALSDWRTVILKERTGFYAYALYGSTDNNRPSGHVFTNADRELRGPAALPVNAWSHLAATYNGSTLRAVRQRRAGRVEAATGNIAANTGAAADRRQHDLGRVLQRPDRRGADLQPRAERDRDPGRHGPQRDGRRHAADGDRQDARQRDRRRARRHRRDGHVQRGDARLDGHRRARSRSSTRRAPPCRRPSVYDTDDQGRHAAPAGRARLRRHLPRHGQGRRARTDLGGNPLPADVTWTFTTEASPPQVLVVGSSAEPVRHATSARSCATRASTRSRRSTSSLISPALLERVRRRAARPDGAHAPARCRRSRNWVNAGGNLIAMRPDKQLAGPARPHRRRHARSSTPTCASTPRSAPGAGIVGSTIQFHGAADRYNLNGARAIATLFSNATTATTNPAVSAALGRVQRRRGGGLHLRPRAVGRLHAPGQPRVGGPGARRRARRAARRHVLPPNWLDTNKIAIPQADEQQRLLVNLITQMERDRMPLPRFWYLPRGEKAVGGDERRRPLAGLLAGRHREPLRALQDAEPGRLRRRASGSACARRRTSIRARRSPTRRRRATSSQGFEVGLHPQFGSCPRLRSTSRTWRSRSTTSWRRGRRSTRASRRPSPAARTASTGRTGRRTAKIELARGIRLDAQLLPLPLELDRRQARLPERRRLPDALRRPRRHADRRLPAEHEHDRRVGPGLPGRPSPRCSTTRSGRTATTACSGRTCTPTTRRRTRAPRRSSASALARGVPVISYKQLLDWVDGRNASTIRGMDWNAGVFTFTTTSAPARAGSRRCCRRRARPARSAR